jgi:hypothetical protein
MVYNGNSYEINGIQKIIISESSIDKYSENHQQNPENIKVLENIFSTINL